jgi:catechol 2,3-dioxygenase-like lactoylglutathione lyase family enzyme
VRKQIVTTGDFGIGLMVHVVHMTDDVAKLTAFYEDVFGGLTYMGTDEPSYLEPEDRWASLIMIGDLCIEAMAPNLPADPTKPVGRFYTKYGQHLHSVGYLVEDLVGLGNRMIEDGIYIGKPGGGKIDEMDPETYYFFPSPRDTAGLMVELCRTHMPNDPRELDTWSSLQKFWKTSHPLGIERMLHVTLGVKDLDSAVKRYVETMQAVPVADGIDASGQYKFQTLHLGDCLLQLAEPLEQDSDLGRHVARWGNMIYSITFRIKDLDSAERWLNSKGVRTSRPSAGVLAANPEDTFDSPYFFTTDVLTSDPFEA